MSRSSKKRPVNRVRDNLVGGWINTPSHFAFQCGWTLWCWELDPKPLPTLQQPHASHISAITPQYLSYHSKENEAETLNYLRIRFWHQTDAQNRNWVILEHVGGYIARTMEFMSYNSRQLKCKALIGNQHVSALFLFSHASTFHRMDVILNGINENRAIRYS